MSTSVTLPEAGPRVRALVVGLAAVAVLALVAGPALTPRDAAAVDTGTTPEHSISVTGSGKVTLSPDVADVQLGVSVQRTTVKAARDDAAVTMTAVIAALKKSGIADADLTTSALSLQPQYDYGNGSAPRLVGYVFSNSVMATVRHLDILGDVIDGAIAAGATSLDGVTFRVDDETAAEAQARSAAMADAKKKADALAAAAGVTITGVISIVESVSPTPYPMPYATLDSAAGTKSVPTPIQAGSTDVTVSVGVVYRIP